MIRSTLRRAAIIFSLAVSVEASAAGSDPVQPSNDELASIVDRVVDTHPAVVAARSTLAAAESDLDGSKWARFPGLTVEGFVDGRDNGRASTVVSLEQPIWSFGRINAGISQAEARVDAARAGVDEAALDLALRASVAYIEYQRLQARDRIYAESVQEHTRLVDSIQRRVDQQISAESDAAYALQRLLTVQQEREQNQVGATLALSRLRELTGMQDLEVKAVLRFSAEEHQPSSDGMLRAALDYSPLNRRLSAEVDAAVAASGIPVVLLGHSLGGYLSLIHALRRPDLGRIAVGAKADLCTVDVSGLLVGSGAVGPEPLSNLLYASGANVRHVITQGYVQLWGGQLVVDDQTQVQQRGAKAVQQIWAQLRAEGWFGR
jgi:outer membrane protein TolC